MPKVDEQSSGQLLQLLPVCIISSFLLMVSLIHILTLPDLSLLIGKMGLLDRYFKVLAMAAQAQLRLHCSNLSSSEKPSWIAVPCNPALFVFMVLTTPSACPCLVTYWMPPPKNGGPMWAAQVICLSSSLLHPERLEQNPLHSRHSINE